MAENKYRSVPVSAEQPDVMPYCISFPQQTSPAAHHCSSETNRAELARRLRSQNKAFGMTAVDQAEGISQLISISFC